MDTPKYQIFQKPESKLRTSPAAAVLCCCLLLVYNFPTCTASQLYRHFDFEKIKSHFDEFGCIKGELAASLLEPPISTSSSPSSGVKVFDDKLTEKCYVLPSTETNAINKEKTPMCLVNELARYNNIQHEYRLTDEMGLAHKKIFYVTLKLGTEEYSAQGARIRQAQHAAAEIALKSTKYKQPVAKTKQSNRPKSNEVTPIFELNALAMKRGEPTVYQYLSAPSDKPQQQQQQQQPPLQTQQPQQPPLQTQQPTQQQQPLQLQQQQKPLRPAGASWAFNGPTRFNKVNKFKYHRDPNAFSVSVRVGDREFIGNGPTSTIAKRAAAMKALDELKTLPISEVSKEIVASVNGDTKELDSVAELKSPISLVYELALKRNLDVTFDVMEEKGPPHMRIFVTKCFVGEIFATTGEGNSKKTSKKKAAEKMLDELKKLPITTTINPSGFVVRRKQNNSKRKRNLIKEHKTEESETQDVNPVSKLIQLQQARKEKEPAFILKDERSLSAYKREFTMEVSVGDNSEIGVGPTKKIAKKNAAKKLLIKLGQVSTAPVRTVKNDDKPTLSSDSAQSNGEKSSGGRQLAPGLLLVPSEGNTKISHNNNNHKQNLESAQDFLFKNGSSGATEECDSIRPKERLEQISQMLGFKVQYTDFTKGSQNDVLSLVSLSTVPPQVCHGQAETRDSSHDLAAANALRALADMGLDSVVPTKKENSVAGGDSIFSLGSDSSAPFMNMNGGPK